MFHSPKSKINTLILALAVGVSVIIPAPQARANHADISAAELVKLTNTERARNRLPKLSVSATLERSAQAKAHDLLERDYFNHDTPDGKTPWTFFTDAGYAYTWAGENLAFDFVTAAPIQQAWMLSPTHAANILNSHYREIGIAVVEGDFNGKHTAVVVQHFGAQNVQGVQTKFEKASLIERLRVFFAMLRVRADRL